LNNNDTKEPNFNEAKIEMPKGTGQQKQAKTAKAQEKLTEQASRPMQKQAEQSYANRQRQDYRKTRGLIAKSFEAELPWNDMLEVR
jgi:hypothetical protein